MVVVPVLTIAAMVPMLMVEGGGTDSGNEDDDDSRSLWSWSHTYSSMYILWSS